MKTNRKTFAFGFVVTAFLLVGGYLWRYSLDTKEPAELPISPRMASKEEIKPLKKAIKQVQSLHEAFKETSWSEEHPEEMRQSFASYVNSDPNRPDEKLTTLYIQPLGDFTKRQTKVMQATADILSRQFGVPVKTLPTLQLDIIPKEAKRVHPSWGMKQILSTYVLDEVLKPKRPDDAVAVLAITTSDLWPGKNWNFVFGQASLRERVGVWSLSRYGNPDDSEEAYQQYLLRTLKIATHETGHMFGIPHCTAYQCGMNGTNSLDETDAGPLTFCPECSAKLWWATKTSPSKWYQRLAQFAKKQKLKDEEKFWQKCYDAVKE